MRSNEIYEHVTNTIIDLLESHLEKWDKPWISLGVDNQPANNPASSQPYYRGINQFLLSFQMNQKGFLKNQWATFSQIKNMNGNVMKGEKSTPVIFYKTAFIDKNKKYHKPDQVKLMNINVQMEKGIETVPVLKLYRVFNLAGQTEGLEDDFYNVKPIEEELTDFSKDQSAEKIIKDTGAIIHFKKSNRAFYDIASDTITLPLREQFKGKSEPFYATAFHELGHWTGSRLNRQFGKRFGDIQYAKEELIAELTSAYCCAHLGFTKTINNNATYIKQWLGILKQDNKAIIKASAQAQKASDYILGGAECAEYLNRDVA